MKGEKMGIQDKIARAKETNWLTDGLSKAEMKSIVELAQISSKIERRRIEMGMTQKEFAVYMGVSQGMVSKWESRDYNFTIKSLNEICSKIDLTFTPVLNNKIITEKFSLIKNDSKMYIPKISVNNLTSENRRNCIA
ncbi:helix-turn-helix domain-containing protein [Butyrivibrio sp. XPD2006]|uniref:helix-turn-helix domain-containing protein n=1 Tax=Butyrivibrio sp. XPD2006 TaxID=1280668 RepID=UPI0003B3167C|nr:helix-turn-helix transcriptional regulator [Butyrivibrio sp. XPD2006]